MLLPRAAIFVIPLAGLLSAVAARLYDWGHPVPEIMGASLSKPQEESVNGNGNSNRLGNERTPLLPRSERASEDTEGRAKKAAKWMAHNAVLVFMTLLITAVIIILCLFFGGKFCSTGERAPANIVSLSI